MNIAVLASGNGSNLQAIINAVKSKKIKAKIVLVFSDKADAFALKRAAKVKIPALHLSPKDFTDRAQFDAAVAKALKTAGVDVVVLAGYMRLLSPGFIHAYEGRILNVHPALLPAFKGAHGIRDAFEYGVKVTGATVHIVTEEMDAGPILAQAAVAVTPKDTFESLAKKIHAVEHKIYPAAIAQFLKTILR